MKRIVVCDDELHILEGLRHLLRGPDRKIVIGHSGVDALEQVRQEVPDLLIIDIMMPKMDGIQAVATLREQEETRHLPIIILTAKGHARDVAMVQEVWNVRVMAKPFEPAKLRQLVAEILETEPCTVPSSN
ncbi:MAG: response regulator [Phycisphaerae bacterium]|nr:response regulator [Phycisphaerae bacterium]